MAPYSDVTFLTPTLVLHVIDKLTCYDYIMKTQASNGDKVLTESLTVKLTLEGKIVNKKARKVWTLFIISQR